MSQWSRREEADPASELGAQLESELTGFRVLDRRLAIDGRPLAEVAGLHEGKLCLALAVDGSEQGSLPRAFAALAFAAANGAALARHLEARAGSSVSDLLPARVLVVAERTFAPAVVELLRPLAGPLLALFERRRLESAAGASTFLARADREPAVAPTMRSAAPPAPAPTAIAISAPPLERFARALRPETAALARGLGARIARIDPELDCEGGEEGLAWFCDGALLCRLEAARDGLEGRLPGSSIPHRIHSATSADAFVEWVLAAHVARLDERDELPADPAPAAEPRRIAQLLTKEEIEAFHA